MKYFTNYYYKNLFFFTGKFKFRLQYVPIIKWLGDALVV